MEGKSPFEEIFASSDKPQKKEEEKEDFLELKPESSQVEETGNLSLAERYINLIVDLVKGKYYYEAIEAIKEMAGEGI